MTKVSSEKETSESEKNHSFEKKGLQDVRNLLIGPELELFQELHKRIEDPVLMAKSISRALPEAVILRAKKDKQLSKALSPTIEKVLKDSVHKNPKIIADAIFPALGPAIRKSITSIVRNMVQSLGRTIDQSFSWKGLKWRFEAIRSKRSFSEVVLLHTLLYRVEHVFLIHKKTGILLKNVGADIPVTKDVDMVSSMLTAIQDFVQDSLEVRKGEGIETLQIGDFSVWIENGPLAILACVIRGNPPHDLRVLLHETLETIHMEFRNTLKSFSGDVGSFEKTNLLLEDCLQIQYKQKKKRAPILVWIFFVFITSLIGYSIFNNVRNNRRWGHCLDLMNKEPGIVVTDVKRSRGRSTIFGLRDPLAEDPIEILKKSKLDPEKVNIQLEPYQASWPEFIIQRVEKLLQLPDTVSIKVVNGVLYLRGSASQSWIADSRQMALSITGIEEVDIKELQEKEYSRIETLKAELEGTILTFSVGSTQISSGQEQTLDELSEQIRKIIDLAILTGERISFEIIGHASSDGIEKVNADLSKDRATHVFSYLESKGISPDLLITKGMGTKEPIRREITEDDRKYNRSVTIQVKIGDNL